mmetsp:Transcript_76847/g.136191  ORF Transcript_76847/g.136191 Transcript_76847/m.136191 type:complete len:218 (+) Transcript_76847:127-780(+)
MSGSEAVPEQDKLLTEDESKATPDMSGAEKVLESFDHIAIVATFFGGFGIADLSQLSQDRAFSMAEKGTLYAYIMCQVVAVALNIFSAIVMTFVTTTTKRLMASAFWKKNGTDAGTGGQLYRAAYALGGETTCLNKLCGSKVMLANVSWLGVLFSMPLYFAALVLKIWEALPDDPQLVRSVLYSVLAVFLVCLLAILIVILRTNSGGPFRATIWVDM